MPTSFSGYSVQCAAFLIKKMLLSTLQNKIPYEILHGKPPKYEMLKPFGCLCYASNLRKDRRKLDPKATPYVFIGYAQSQKGLQII